MLQALQNGDLAGASALVAQYRRLNGDTPEALEAFSWLARGELASGDAPKAVGGTPKRSSRPHKPRSLPANSIASRICRWRWEPLTRSRRKRSAKQGQRSEALRILRQGLLTWRGTSLVDRLQKNINLITLQGRPMPVLRETAFIGAKPANPNAWRGKPLLLFFWAHWCADCKAEVPIIARLAAEFEPKGLAVIAPTRLYGYTAEDDNAAPAKEQAFTEKVFEKYYARIPNAPAPLDSGNFQRFGASTTPTILLIDRRGIVQLYHPGVIEEADLRAAIEQIVLPIGAKRSAAPVGR